VWSPLAAGFLSGKYTRENLKDPGNRYAGFDFLPFDKERGFALVEKLRVIAQRHAASVSQVALSWVLANATVTSILLGATKLTQLEDNLGAASIKLTTAELSELNEATALLPLYPHWFNQWVNDKPVVAALSRD
jgi:aryl-alcohol dehydrogenase-like predicted oxidoreductase